MKKGLMAFREYDVRGLYPSEVNEDLFYKIGRAFKVWSKSKKVYVGYDNRVSSKKLALALRTGLRDQGADVVDLGLVSTPMLYFASKNNDALMVTASHNPAKYNGIKFMRKGVKPVSYSNGLDDIEKLVKKDRWPKSKVQGRLTRVSNLNSYIEHVLSFAKDIKEMHVMIDTGNGMGGFTLPHIIDDLLIKVTAMNLELDGRFPIHTPNPILPENVRDLVKQVKKKKDVDFGVAFDADMDRIVFVDETGRVIPSDIMLALLAKYMLKPNDSVVYDLRTSHSVVDAIRSAGGKPIECKVGRTHVMNKMRRNKAVLGGELSGHFYFKENDYVESADIAFVKVLNIMSKSSKTLSQLVDPFFEYERSGEINFKVEDKDQALKLIAKEFKDGKQSKLDGITVEYEDGWFNVRPSNTEPLMRVVIEAEKKKDVDLLKKKIKKILSNS
jgi:phosphomannomutase